jgi:sterol desaturase/sphingolipid hydroxylase (fatty acid hydroxylase superfamily)
MISGGIQGITLIERWLLIYGVLLLRYIIFAGILFLIFYVWKKRELLYKKIQSQFPEPKRIWFEIKYSLSTFAVFATMACANFWLTKNGYTKIYFDIAEHGWCYFVFSLVALIVIHDTYFYWAHRFMHLPGIFERVHKVHHRSNNPTPFAAFSFHPIEAVIEFGVIFIVSFLFPIHRFVILAFALFMIANNVIGHLGFELYPKGFTKNKLTFWLNTSTNHNMHHKFVSCNYGLYFNIWDRLMATNHKKYHDTFDEVAGRKRIATNTSENDEQLVTA